MQKQFFIGEQDFRVWLPDVQFLEKSNDDFDSRKISGIMSTDRKDRQGEIIVAKGLTFEDFLKSGHFNDNHSQETSAIVGYPTAVKFHQSLSEFGMAKASGWSCEGYVIKGTKRADGIWELAKALAGIPNRKLGFSIEGKVIRREDKTIERANIRNVAITNCPVNTDCSWDLLEKSFHESDIAMKSMMAGHGGSSGGAVLATESLDSDVKEIAKKKKKREEALKAILSYDDLLKAMEYVLDTRPDFTDEAAAMFVNHLFNKKGGRL